MTKFLLSSTALIIALPFVSPVHAAKPAKELTPAVKFSGETSFNVHGFKQSKREGNGGKGNGHYMEVADSRFNVEISQKLENYGGLECSGLIGLSGNPDNGNVQENRLKLKGNWGTLILGNTRGPDDFMAVGAFAVMGATGGFAGNYTNVFNQTTGAVVTTDLAGRPKDATKAMYITPRIGGFQAGLGLTSSTVHKGDHKLETINPSAAKSAPFDKNQLNAGLNFKEVFANGLKLKASATGLFGKTQNPIRPTGVPMSYHDTKSYALGLQLGYQGWDFGAEYINNGKSQVAKYSYTKIGAAPVTATNLTGADAGKAFSLALGYELTKKDAVALGYYSSKRKVRSDYAKAKANVYSATWDHKLGPGLGLYAEGNIAHMKTDDRAVSDQNNYKALAKDIGLNGGDLADGVGRNKFKGIITGIKLKF